MFDAGQPLLCKSLFLQTISHPFLCGKRTRHGVMAI
jgi:hypothetical protein